MENASKALLIAGAILICILLIAVAMYIYNSASSTVDTAVNQMSDNEKQMYNAKVKNYLGDVKKGSEVKAMISQIIDMNQSNVGKSGMFISILTAPNDNTGAGNCKAITGQANQAAKLTNWDDGANLMAKCNAANFYDNGENNTAKVAEATAVMNTLKNKINASKSYIVTADYESGAIIRVHIAQLDF